MAPIELPESLSPPADLPFLPSAQSVTDIVKDFLRCRRTAGEHKFMLKGELAFLEDSNAYRQFAQQVLGGLRLHRLPVRSSGFSDLGTCPRLFFFRDRLGLRKIGKGSAALTIGILYHLFNEHTYKGLIPTQVLSAVSQYLNDFHEQLKGRVDDTGLLPDATPFEEVLALDEQAFALSHVMYLYSYERFFKARFLHEEGWKVLMVERPITIKYPGIPARIRCKSDAVLVHEPTKRLMIVNHKTTSHEPVDVAATYRYALQPQIEHLCLQQAYPDYKVAFYLHNIIKKCTLRYPAKKYPTFESYLTAVKAWYDEQYQKDPNSPPLLQSLMALPERAMHEELFLQLHETSVACNAKLNPVRFFRREGQCRSSFGRSLCPYHDLCSVGVESWADLIASRYIQEFREEAEDAEE